ncbi:uncharacterized protein TNCV_3778081 [Trichonephila clavipes]|nr:uncharacterized protein TNCV_3778081 [Trichonephila clavipes]
MGQLSPRGLDLDSASNNFNYQMLYPRHILRETKSFELRTTWQQCTVECRLYETVNYPELQISEPVFSETLQRKNEGLQEILNEEHQETHRNVSPSEQEEDERGPMPTSAIKDLLKKWADVGAMVLEWHPNQADVSRVGDL